MTDEQKQFFSNVNEAWGLLKPYVKDPQPYKKVLNDCYKIFFEQNTQKFSYDWWQETISKFFSYAGTYSNKPLDTFVGELSMGILNFFEYQYKLNDNSFDMLYKTIEGVFIDERDRITKGVSSEVLPEE